MTYFILYLLILIIPTIASINIQSNYKKYKAINNSKKISGQEVARKILDANGLEKLYIVEVTGDLTDHYDPTQKVVRLSTNIFHGETIAAAAVAAHECGHAIQDKVNYPLMKIRSKMVPVVNFVTYAAYILFIISCFLQAVDLAAIAVISVLFGLAFQLVTLPVEIDASKRALKQLQELNLVAKNEYNGTKKMLISAALTYVAAVLSSVLNLLRLVISINDNRR